MEQLDAKRRYWHGLNPVCIKHQRTLVVRSTRATVRYLYCPVPGCKASCCLPRREKDEANPAVL